MPRRLWLVVALTLSVATLAGTLLPPSSLPRTAVLAYDKLLHAGAFFALAFAWRRAVSRPGTTLLILAALVAITEGGQAFLATGRTADPLDALADVIGGVMGLLVERVVGWGRPGSRRR